jgi:tetratricopeptide (TPR) repeat protein
MWLAAGDSQSNLAADSIFSEGMALARSGKFAEAEQTFRRGMREYPLDKRFPSELAGVAYRLKQNESAKRYLHDALRIDPDDAYSNDFLASLYFFDTNLPAALKYWNRVNKPLIQDIRFVPPPPVDSTLLRRATMISGGQILSLRRLMETKANLDRLDIFVSEQFDLMARDDRRFDLTVRLRPAYQQPSASWYGGLPSYFRDLPYQTLHFDRDNIARRAINFTSLLRWDSNKRRASAEISGPASLNPRYRYRFTVDGRDEHWDLSRTYRAPGPVLSDLLLRRIEGGGDLIMGITRALEWTAGLRIVRRSFRNENQAAVFARKWSFEQENRLKFQFFDWPEHRVYASTAGEIRTGPSFAILQGDLNGVWFPTPRGDRWQVEARLRAGKSFGTIPFDELFQLGMERDNSLWLRGIEGARDGRKGNAPLGTEFALGQIGVNRRLFEIPFLTVKIGPFFDFGRTSDPSGDFGSRGWVPAAGVEATILTLSRLRATFVYGRDLRSGRGAFYSATSR